MVKELPSLVIPGMSLYNMGLIRFDILADHIIGNKKFGLSQEEMHEICALFADWMMSEGAVSYPEAMNRDERSFYAHNGIEHEYTLSDANPQSCTLSFMPSRADLSNKRLAYLEKVLRKKGTLPEQGVVGLLDAIWNRSRFYVCQSCGYTELDEKRFTPTMTKKHRTASGWQCSNNRLQNFSLAYRFETDVLTLRFTGMEITTQEQALSLLYGILEGASRALEVERSDISGCLKWFWNQDSGRGNYGFVFYDKTPGGAGHVRRMQNVQVLDKVLREALDTISSCTCGGSELDTSCYSCLRNYYNQKHHELLQRKYVIEFLHELFS